VRGYSNEIGKIRQPKRQIHKWIAVLEEGAAAGLRPSEAPTNARRRKLVVPRAYADHSAELSPLEKTIELLHVASEPMVVPDYNFSPRLLAGRQNALDAARCERQRPLA
jgi:hypothetical protein